MDFEIIKSVKIGLFNLDYSLSDSTRVIRFLLCCTFLRWRQHMRSPTSDRFKTEFMTPNRSNFNTDLIYLKISPTELNKIITYDNKKQTLQKKTWTIRFQTDPVKKGLINRKISKRLPIASRKNASISNFRDSFRWKNEYLWCIIETTTIFDFSENFFFEVSTNKFWMFKFLQYMTSKSRKFATFEVQILTKIRQNHEYLQIILLPGLAQRWRYEGRTMKSSSTWLNNNELYSSSECDTIIGLKQSFNRVKIGYRSKKDRLIFNRNVYEVDSKQSVECIDFTLMCEDKKKTRSVLTEIGFTAHFLVDKFVLLIYLLKSKTRDSRVILIDKRERETPTIETDWTLKLSILLHLYYNVDFYLSGILIGVEYEAEEFIDTVTFYYHRYLKAQFSNYTKIKKKNKPIDIDTTSSDITFEIPKNSKTQIQLEKNPILYTSVLNIGVKYFISMRSNCIDLMMSGFFHLSQPKKTRNLQTCSYSLSTRWKAQFQIFNANIPTPPNKIRNVHPTTNTNEIRAILEEIDFQKDLFANI
ncbi:hypothetical protein AGLY_014385 [Aphis glycines]|uniref:Uncharacterized protein n=1 Tax=Aphis glycines TaxID=307491 RepID=A0A6G0T3H5_APHGL|nr:hypothetical protein AGLY_014385 [Aphis glycines]